MRLIRYRIARRYAPGFNKFVVQRSILWLPWKDAKINGECYHNTADKALENIPDYYKKLPYFRVDLKVWPVKGHVNTEL